MTLLEDSWPNYHSVNFLNFLGDLMAQALRLFRLLELSLEKNYDLKRLYVEVVQDDYNDQGCL